MDKPGMLLCILYYLTKLLLFYQGISAVEGIQISQQEKKITFPDDDVRVFVTDL